MKIIFCFIVLFSIGHCTDYSESGSYWSEYANDGVYQYNNNYDDKNSQSANNDTIIYPCAVHDTHCIRRVFTQNSRCTSAEGPTPDPYTLKLQVLDIPHANLTILLRNAYIKGLHNWKIQEFYVNKTSDRLLFEVVFDQIVLSSPNVTLRIYRRGQEPIETSDFGSIEFDDVSLTLTIPHAKDLQLYRGHVYTYLPNAFPIFTLGPGLVNSTDPVTLAAVTQLTTNVNIGIREAFVTLGPQILSVFLQSTICNYEYQ